MNKSSVTRIFLFSSFFTANIIAQDEQKPAPNNAAEIAKKLANPIGALISLPFQNNMDVGIGDYNGSINTLNIQPIVPFNLNQRFSLISRYILPGLSQHDITGENTQQSGSGLMLNSELTEKWEAGTTNAYIILMAGGLIKFGTQMDQLQIGHRLQVAAPEGNISLFGGRTAAALIFPKK
jgi:hypothetical protein